MLRPWIVQAVLLIIAVGVLAQVGLMSYQIRSPATVDMVGGLTDDC